MARNKIAKVNNSTAKNWEVEAMIALLEEGKTKLLASDKIMNRWENEVLDELEAEKNGEVVSNLLTA